MLETASQDIPEAMRDHVLSIADEYINTHNPNARLALFGQEVNAESYAICMADMLITGHEIDNIVFGNTLSNPGHREKRFDYMLANPPFGVDWGKVEKDVRDDDRSFTCDGRAPTGGPTFSRRAA